MDSLTIKPPRSGKLVLAPLQATKKPMFDLPPLESGLKENGRADFKFEQPPQSAEVASPDRGLVDRRTNPNFPLTMVQSNVAKNMGRTGGMIKLDVVAEQDRVPEGQELENKEDVIKKAAGYFKAIANPDVPNYVESIITSKFYPVHKPPTIETVERVPEYESTEELYEKEMLSYLDSMQGFQAKFFLFISGLLAGIAILHWYVCNFSSNTLTFMTMYTHVAKGIETIFHILTFICAIFGLLLALLNFSSYRKAINRLSPQAGVYMIHFVLYCIAFGFYGITVILTEREFKEVVKFHFEKPSKITGSSLDTFKIISGIRNALLIIAWVLTIVDSTIISDKTAENVEIHDEDETREDSEELSSRRTMN